MFVFRPFAYLRRMSDKKPIIFYSVLLGLIGPIAIAVVPPFRRNYLGYRKPEEIPTSYPVPKRSRNPPSGYDD